MVNGVESLGRQVAENSQETEVIIPSPIYLVDQTKARTDRRPAPMESHLPVIKELICHKVSDYGFIQAMF